MGKIKILNNIKYSYAINDDFAVAEAPEERTIINVISSDNNVTLTLTPETIYNTNWYDIYTFNLKIENKSHESINNFDVKLNICDNLLYISGSLVNSITGMYYPGIDWEETYCTIESLPPEEILNLTYSLKSVPDSSYYISNPLYAYNSTSATPVHSNVSEIYISEQKVNVIPSSNNMTISVENSGTITSDSFTYKFANPAGTQFSNALLNGVPYTDISHTKLGAYTFLKIGSLPASTPSSPQILLISFS